MKVFTFTFRNVSNTAGVICAESEAAAVALMAEAIQFHEIESDDGGVPEFDFTEETHEHGLVVLAEPGNTYVYPGMLDS